MSIQAVAWVLSQKGEDLPGTARLVMIALANHADHTSGHCWPSIETISREAGCGERTASRYLGALRRNGWLDVRSTQRASGKFRSNDYWILFDHKPVPWRYYDKETEESDNEETVADVPHANLADGHSETPLHEMAYGPYATVGVAQSLLEPSIFEPSAPPRPNGFDPNARANEQAKLQAAEEARKPKGYFVFKDSEPWKYRVKLGHRSTLFTWSPEHKAFGWWFEGDLYPPKATGTPRSPNMTSEDEEELAKKWG